jgi:hypothetical protein
MQMSDERESAGEDNDQIEERRRSLEQIIQLGLDPYPHRFERTHSLSQILQQFSTRTGEELEADRPQARVAGRIHAINKMGKAAFIRFSDGAELLQIYIKSNEVELLVGPGMKICDDSLAELKPANVPRDRDSFELPADFGGMISIRAKTSSESRESGWVQDRWIHDGMARGPLGRLSHCPQTIVDTSFSGGGLSLLGKGWSTPESWGTWSTDSTATLAPIVVPESQLNSDFLFEVNARAFIAAPDQAQTVRMLANGIVVANWLFTPSNSERVVRALIPRLLLTKERVLNISFEIANALYMVLFASTIEREIEKWRGAER